MMKLIVYNCMGLLLLGSLLSSCNKPEAEKMGVKWCECHQNMAKFFKELDSEKALDKKNVLISNIMSEQGNVIECMGGEEKLKDLNNKLSGAEKSEFQALFDKTRESMCAETVKLLKKRPTDHSPEPELKQEPKDTTPQTPSEEENSEEEEEEEE